MYWKHTCSIDWMRARQQCLTASDIKELLPITATGRTRKIDDMTRLKVLSRKLVEITEDDCVSTGAAARGHMLEPYAIKRFNSYSSYMNLNHWDDQIVKCNDDGFGLAFSPDACDIEQHIDRGPIVYAEPKVIGEVKCYSPEKHMICGYTDKSKLEERWQVATAMAACESIEQAYLLFFNPSMNYSLFIAKYFRDDLIEEIDVIRQVEQQWHDFIRNGFKQMDRLEVSCGIGCTELEIIEEIEQRQRLNP